jgi:hypothetical protein
MFEAATSTSEVMRGATPHRAATSSVATVR